MPALGGRKTSGRGIWVILAAAAVFILLAVILATAALILLLYKTPATTTSTTTSLVVSSSLRESSTTTTTEAETTTTTTTTTSTSTTSTSTTSTTTEESTTSPSGISAPGGGMQTTSASSLRDSSTTIPDFTETADCLNRKGVKLFVSDTCMESRCKGIRDLFGTAFVYLNVINCDLDGNEEECDAAREDVDTFGFPMWYVGLTGEYYPGATVARIREVTGC